MIKPEEETRVTEKLEELVWSPDNELSDKVIDQFLVIARSVGTCAGSGRGQHPEAASLHVRRRPRVTSLCSWTSCHAEVSIQLLASLKLVSGAPKLVLRQDGGLDYKMRLSLRGGHGEIWKGIQ